MKIYVTFIMLFFSLVSLAQVNQEVTVTGRGKDCKEAEKDAYEKGLSQGGGAYYASNKEMINRQLVNESLEVLKTGNVLRASTITPCKKAVDGSFEIVMKVTVSQTELKKFVESKGKSVGYSGEEIVRKKKMEEQAEANELKVIKNILRQLENLASDPFDFFWEPDTPKFIPPSKWNVSGKVIVQYNQNYYNTGKKIIGELNDVSLKPADIQFRKDYMNRSLIKVFINEKPYYLRNELSKDELLRFYKSLNEKQDHYLIVDGANKDRILLNKKEELVKVADVGTMIYPAQGTLYKEISGNIIMSELDFEKLNRITVVSKQRKQQINRNPTQPNDLMLYYYSETNPIEFNKLKSRLEETIESIANERPEGRLNFEYKINFTPIGKNKSELIYKDGFGSVFQFKLEDAVAKANISPSMIGDKYTKSNDSILVNLNWQSNKETILFSSKSQSLSSNFKALDLPFGTYKTDVKAKELNGLTFYDQKIIKYQTRGPFTAVNSILLPGWGTRKVTYNEKSGWGRFAMVAVPILSSFTFEMMSRNNFNNYRQTDVSIEGNMADSYYNKANSQRRASLVFAGVGVAAYVFDISWVINQGIKNNKNKKRVNDLINQEDGLYLRRQPLKL